MSMYAIAFFASFSFIFLKSWQQLNVVHRKYLWIVPTSMAMAMVEVYVVASIAKFGFGWLVLWVGLGSGLGSLCATWMHSKVTK